MTEENRKWVKSYTEASFSRIVDFDETRKITNALLDDIVADVEECADENFYGSDIDIAIGRVLMNRLGIE